MYSDISTLVSRLPVKFERFIMKMSIIFWVCELFANDRDEGSVVEVAYEILLWTRVLQATVERDGDQDQSPFPPCIPIYPFYISVVVPDITCLTAVVHPIKFIPGQYAINLPPFCALNIFREKIYTSDNVQEFIEAFLRFLDPTIPVPFAQ
jgi:hypothetical protein